MKIYIIGSGKFGTAISNELANNPENNVLLYCRSKNRVNEINYDHYNEKY